MLRAHPATTVVDFYLARGRLRAEIPMQGFGRLSDLFNNQPGEFIGAFTHMASTAGAAEAGVVRRDLVVRLRDVRLVRPIDERPQTVDLAALHERMPARVVLDLDGNRFISVNNASVRFVGVAEPLECDYLLVNGGRISALYEVM